MSEMPLGSLPASFPILSISLEMVATETGAHSLVLELVVGAGVVSHYGIGRCSTPKEAQGSVEFVQS